MFVLTHKSSLVAKPVGGIADFASNVSEGIQLHFTSETLLNRSSYRHT